MPNDEEDLQELIDSWRSTASGSPPVEDYAEITHEEENISVDSGTGDFSSLILSSMTSSFPALHHQTIDTISIPPPVLEASGLILSDLAVPETNVVFRGDAFTIYDENREAIKISYNGEVTIHSDLELSNAAKLFWEHIQIEGFNSKEQMNALKAQKNALQDRVKELEIKLGYRKPDTEEEMIDRFESLDVD